jgi:S1-C subfamily serine protease
MLPQLSAGLALLLMLGTAQDASTLRVQVSLVDASGTATPVPRLVLLISDDPPVDEPRRVRTAADGTVELKLAPGRYTVELDEPISFRGKAYTWTQIVEVAAGRQTVLDLTAGNAEAAASARISADSATLLAAWRDSVVEIWTPTRHASGFVIDAARGLIATTDRALGGQTSVEVELTTGAARFKVAGRVVTADYETGAAFVWVNPEAVARMMPIDLRCSTAARPEVNYQDPVATIGTSVLAPKQVSDGRITKATPQAIFSDLRIGNDGAGGPVFTEAGHLLGISSIDDPGELRRWNDGWIVPLERACKVVPGALAAMKGPAPSDARLPIDPPSKGSAIVTGKPQAAAAKAEPQIVKASNFDVTIMTSQMARDIRPSRTSVRADFGNWNQYVRDAPLVLLVRISPQFEEAMWKTLARGYAALQGVWLNSFKSFTANFLRMRAYCGESEVLPVHPFIIEHAIPDRSPIREGLYVFEAGAFGPHCPVITFSMFSEKDPQRADTKVIDPKVFEELAKP